MRKNVAIPKELAEKISEIAEIEDWSFSKTLCYLAFIGLEHLTEVYQNNPDRYNEYKTNFNFDVDNPKKRIIYSDY